MKSLILYLSVIFIILKSLNYLQNHKNLSLNKSSSLNLKSLILNDKKGVKIHIYINGKKIFKTMVSQGNENYWEKKFHNIIDNFYTIDNILYDKKIKILLIDKDIKKPHKKIQWNLLKEEKVPSSKPLINWKKSKLSSVIIHDNI